MAQSMYLIARFPNFVDDFGEPVYLQATRAGIEKSVLTADITDAGVKSFAQLLDSKSFPGALVPSSALDTTDAGDLKLVATYIGGD